LRFAVARLAPWSQARVRWRTFRDGTQRSGFGFPSTGKSVTFRGINISLSKDGRLAEHCDVVDGSEFESVRATALAHKRWWAGEGPKPGARLATC
jgi:hypothetical protein